MNILHLKKDIFIDILYNRTMLNFIKSSKSYEDWVEENQNEICFIGRSNVGKSSLINALFKTKTVKVGKTPGKTQLINFFKDEFGNSVVDLPGYGYAKLSKNQQNEISEMIYQYISRRKSLTKIFLLIDSRTGFTPLDEEFYLWASKLNIPIVIVATKCDKLNQSQRHKIKKHFDNLHLKYFLTSSTKRELLKDLSQNLFKK